METQIQTLVLLINVEIDTDCIIAIRVAMKRRDIPTMVIAIVCSEIAVAISMKQRTSQAVLRQNYVSGRRRAMHVLSLKRAGS